VLTLKPPVDIPTESIPINTEATAMDTVTAMAMDTAIAEAVRVKSTDTLKKVNK